MLIQFDYSTIFDYINEEEFISLESKALLAQKQLIDKTGLGKEYTGWIDLPVKTSKNLLDDINNTAVEIQNNSDCMVVIGIGGSYLGSRAIIETLNHNFYTQLDERKYPIIYFAGINVNSEYLSDLMDLLRKKNVSLNVISKSGGTMEIQASFKILKDLIEKKYGYEEAKKRIYVTTGKKGILRDISEKEGYKIFDIPHDVGGRYSVLTPVGLLPLAVAGVDIYKVIEGAKYGYKLYNREKYFKNDTLIYAVIRYLMYQKGKSIEIFSCFNPSMTYFLEWLKQLFAESEGKDNKGIFPVSLNLSTDLHSLGQYVQEGQRIMFETFIYVNKVKKDLVIGEGVSDYLRGKKFSQINDAIYRSTIKAHNDGGVPTLSINLPEKNEYYLGQLIYFFEKACGISGYLLEVNPFNQPGVEIYKKHTIEILKQNN